MNEEERENYLIDMRNRDQGRRNNMNQEERNVYHANMRNRNQERRNGIGPVQHIQYNIGEMNVNCHHCGALRFQHESFNCCHNGKVSLPNLREYPEQLRRFFEGNDRERTNFREYIRNYNSAFAFASFGANISQPVGRGPYCFRIHGQTYHHVSSLHPVNNDGRKYGQLYIIDAQDAVQAGSAAPENSKCLRSNMEAISNVM